MTIPKSNCLPVVPESLALAIIFITSLCCINSYDGTFAFDDSPAIVNNPDVTSAIITTSSNNGRPLLDIFQNDFWGNKLALKHSHKSYRPLTILTFRFNYWIRGQLNPVDFHIVNLILHTVASLLTYFVYKILLDKQSQHFAFYSATLFACHPVHCEAVSGIVGRADILCTIFVWLSILFYNRSCSCCIHLHHHQQQHNQYTFAGNLCICISCIVAAMLCKETGITAIGLCLGYELIIVHKQNIYDLSKILFNSHQLPLDIHQEKFSIKSHPFIRVFTLFITGIILFGIRFHIQNYSTPRFQSIDNPASFIDNFIFRSINYQYIYSLNIWLLICPQWLSFDWSMGCVPLINNWTDTRLLAILTFWITFIPLIVQSLFIKIRHQSYNSFTTITTTAYETSRYVAIGLCFMIIPFLPASNLFFNVGFVLAERTLYLPSAGYCFIIVIGFGKLSHHLPSTSSKILLIMYFLSVVTWFSRSWIRSEQWRNEFSLFHSALRVCPHNAKVHYNIAKTAADAGDYILAESKYRNALRLNPNYSQVMNNLGNLLKDRKRYEEAKELLSRAVELQTDFAAAWMNLGIVHAALKQYENAEQCYKTSLFHRQLCPDCYYNLGLLFMERMEYMKALDAWAQTIEQDKRHRRAWINTIRLLDDLGMADKALEKGKIAIEILPNDATIHLNFANVLGKLERFSEAEVEFQYAASIDSTNPIIFTNLGVLYHRWNKLHKAREMYSRALEINPDATSAKNNLEKLKNLLQKNRHVK